jgi:HK97 family phage portal protein
LIGQRFFDQFFTKTIYQLRRIGITERPLAPSANLDKLIAWYRRNELVYACVSTIADAAIDPRLVFEVKQDNGTWKEEAHALTDLIRFPNPTCDATNLMTHWVVSEHIAGAFYAEIVRSRGSRQPVELWPLHPARLKPIPTESGKILPIHKYEWQDGDVKVEIDHDKIFVHRNHDITNPFHGLPPLAVALGSVDADTAQTDFVRAFFDNGGVPSGFLKIKGKILNERDKTRLLEGWLKKYDRWGDYARGPAILDENAEYERIGANLDELESQTLRMAGESRICGVFGVPPLLVSAVIGLAYVNQRASAAEAKRDFWQNKMGPLFKRYRSWLEHSLLTEWEERHDITRGKIRLGWDMSEVAALQEELDTKLTRAREDFKAGAITLNQYLEARGLPRDAKGDYYLRPVNVIPVGADQIEQQQEAVLYATRQAVLLGMTFRRDEEEAAVDEVIAGGGQQDQPKAQRQRKAEQQQYRYKASNDKGTCEECQQWSDVVGFEDELPEVPNPKCGGGYGQCRCWLEPVE